MSATKFSAGGFVDCTKKMCLPRRFSRNCRCCSPLLKEPHLTSPNGPPSLLAIFSAKGSLDPSENTLYSGPLDIAGSIQRGNLYGKIIESGQLDARTRTRTPGKHHKSTSFFYAGVPPRKIGRPQFSQSFLHGKPAGSPTPSFSNPGARTRI